MEDRVRKVNIDSLTVERAEELSKQIGDKVVKLQMEAAEKINKVLNVYGMKAQISVTIAKMDEEKG
jgi:hypothetical protein